MTRPIIALAVLVSASATVHAQSGWHKKCEKTATSENVCLTFHQSLNESGKLLVSVAVRQIEGRAKQALLIMVPLGVLLEPGLRVTIFPKALREKLKTGKVDKGDEINLKAVKLNYTLCHAAGCVAEAEATPDLVADLKASAGARSRRLVSQSHTSRWRVLPRR